MEEPNEIVKYKGYEIGVFTDHDPMNPRKEWDNATRMLAYHPKYVLGDSQVNEEYIPNVHRSEIDETEVIKQVNANEHPVRLKLLTLYDHGGITISSRDTPSLGRAGGEWDTSNVGFQWMTLKEVLDEGPGLSPEIRHQLKNLSDKEDTTPDQLWAVLPKETREWVNRIMDGEVKAYDHYMTGDVYGYMIRYPGGLWEGGVWGFFPDDSNGYAKRLERMLGSAKAEVDSMPSAMQEAAKDAAEEAEAAVAKARKLAKEAGLATDLCPTCGGNTKKAIQVKNAFKAKGKPH